MDKSDILIREQYVLMSKTSIRRAEDGGVVNDEGVVN